MKNLGPLRYFFGIEVASSPKGYFLSQAKYANEVIHRAGLTDTKLSDTPIELNVKLNTTDGVPLDDPTLYRKLVGCLVYLTVTRPDLAFVVHVVSQFVSARRSTYSAALLRILRCLRSTIFQGLLFFSTSSLDLVAYADADWAGDVNDRKSTSGFCIYQDCYCETIYPVPIVGKLGFSKQNTITSISELVMVMRCSSCGKKGHHNKNTSKEVLE
ncbi:uncharacterized protein LOC114312561 [Camellia sinensis]|uniref:uncharacterized protein LOC114312561 n=1 Tax=Camellia sinensis TaxID=4442 RepID=UPI0010367CEA|nr:uncharacterized protein LOC114312561 [Camellia sinensis]